MSSFQVYDALSALYKLKKTPIKHLEGFIYLPKEGGELPKKFQNCSSKILAQETERIPPLDQ
jgi:hypothetical protein